MLPHIVQTQRARVGDQDAEDAVAARKVADGGVRGGVDADCEEALEALPAVVEDAEGRVPGAGQLTCDLEHPIQQPLDVEFRDERLPDLEEAEKTLLSEDGLSCWLGHGARSRTGRSTLSVRVRAAAILRLPAA